MIHLEFRVGEQRIIPGVEKAVIGMNVGESKSTTIPSDEAYGPRRPELVIVVPRAELPNDIDPEGRPTIV